MTCEEIQISVGPKVRPAALPGPVYIEVTFPAQKPFRFFYLLFQNYYTASVTLKQLLFESWTTILRNYKLTNTPHFENDAQNWYLIPATYFSSDFQPEGFSKLRIYLTQPSPNWLDFTLKNIKCYSVFLVPVERPIDTRRSSFQQLKDQIESKRTSAQASASKPLITVLPTQYDDTIRPGEEVRTVDLRR